MSALPVVRVLSLPAALLLGLAVSSEAQAYTPTPARTVRQCDSAGRCKDVYIAAFPNAGACTRFFRQWRDGYEDDEKMDACTDFMGINKYCDDRGAYAAVTTVSAPGTWRGDVRVLKCTPKYHADTIDEQFIHIWTGIGEGLLTAAPFVGEGVLAVTCLYGQIYACAVLALEVSDQAGLEIPTEVGDALYVANKAPQCIDGDVVACAYLGACGAKAVGLEIPGVPAIKIFEDQQKCTDGDFAACVRLGREAADAGGVDTGNLTGDILDAQACLDGNKDTCFKLAKEAVKDQVPLDGVQGAAESAQACKEGDRSACEHLGKYLSAAATGLSIDVVNSAPFGANACVSTVIAKGPVDLASIRQDQHATSVSVFAADGSRFGLPSHPSTRDGGWADSAKWASGDFNSDGKSDLLAAWNDGGSTTLTLRLSSGSRLVPAHWAIRAGTWVDSTVWLPGDFNGDGRLDVAGVWDDGDLTSIAVYLSDGTHFAAPVQWSRRDGGWSDDEKWAVGDFTGDGKADIVAIWNDGGSNTLTVRQSTGAGFAQAHWAVKAGGWMDTTTWVAGDFNGDGRLDLAGAWHDGDATSIAVYPSDGRRFTGWSQWSRRDGGWMDDVRWIAGDFSGDGKADIAAAWNNGGSTTLTVRQSTGSSFTQAHWLPKAGAWSATAAWCAGHFPVPAPPDFAERSDPHAAARALFEDPAASTSASADPANAASPSTPTLALGRVKTDGAASTAPLSLCDAARSARARNSPAAPGLERQCTASGGSFAPLPALDAGRIDALAATGATIAQTDPSVAAARNGNASASYQRGFDIASGLFGDPALGAAGNTLMGPGSARIRDSLDAAGQQGFNDSVNFHLARKYR